MTVPKYILGSIDLLPSRDRARLLHNLMVLRGMEQHLPRNLRKFAKLLSPNAYVYKGSENYRIVFEIEDGQIIILDIVHRDQIKLAIRHRGERP